MCIKMKPKNFYCPQFLSVKAHLDIFDQLQPGCWNTNKNRSCQTGLELRSTQFTPVSDSDQYSKEWTRFMDSLFPSLISQILTCTLWYDRSQNTKAMTSFNTKTEFIFGFHEDIFVKLQTIKKQTNKHFNRVLSYLYCILT